MPISAPRDYEAGDLIYSETPFVWVLPKEHHKELCQLCCRSGFNLRLCKQCLTVKYCGKVCQKKDWRLHRLECKQMVNLPDDKDNYDLVRLLGRVFLKIKDKNWKHFKTSVLGTEVNFDEIDPHYKEMAENPYLNLMYKEVKEDVTRFIGAENMPKDIDCLKIVGKVASNTFLDVDKNMSLCFFIGISKFESECISNSSFAVSSSGLKIWANKHIQKLSDEVTIPKQRFLGGPSLSSVFDSIAKLPCKCDDCNLPYGVSVLSRILDEKKAYSIIKKTQAVLKLTEVLPRFLHSELEDIVNAVLEDHKGVLGRTNALHLKLMAFRYLEIGGRAWDIVDDMEDLEMLMRCVFGEFYSEMLEIYKSLTAIYFQLGNPLRVMIYLQKTQKLEKFMNIP